MTKYVKPKIRSNYESTDDFPGIDFPDPSLTLQSEAEACDINNILARVKAGGLLEANSMPPKFGDFSNQEDYLTSLTLVMDAQERFDALPANIRARFQNDPAELLGFVNDLSNKEEAIKLGLVREDVKMPEKNSPASPGNEKPDPATK